MTSELFGGLMLVCLIILMFVGMPVYLCFMGVGLVGFIVLATLKHGLFQLGGVVAFGHAFSWTLGCLPLFILMGQLTFSAGITVDIFNAAYRWLGRVPGGLAATSMTACTIFAACTGSSTASAASMGAVCLPEMNKYGYNRPFACATVAAGGTLAHLIPPSLGFIMYGLLTEQSIGQLFIAGILPGLLSGFILISYIIIRCVLNPTLGPRGPSFTWRERVIGLKSIWSFTLLIGLVLGGMYAGVLTPTEAGAIGAVGAFFIGVARKALGWQATKEALYETGRITGMVVAIYIGGVLFSQALQLSGFTKLIAETIIVLPINRYLILALILLTFIPLGMSMNPVAMLVLTIPIYFPVIISLGFDPILFGVLQVIMQELAVISPPVAGNVFVVAAVAKDTPVERIFGAIIPFCLLELVILVILIAFPQISLFLPQMMFK